MLNRRGAIAVALALVTAAGIAVASTGSIINELYPSSVSRIARIQGNIAIVRSDLANDALPELRALAARVDKVFSAELPRQVELLAEVMKNQAQGKDFSLSTLTDEERSEFLATLMIVAPEGEPVEEAISDERISMAIVTAGYRILTGGTTFVQALTSDKTDSAVQEERARLLLDFARFDVLTSYFIILVEKSSA